MHRSVPAALTLLTLTGAVWLTPATVNAEAFKLWFAGRGEYFSGQSDVFNEFSQPYGGGVELGLEVLYITAFVDALAMSSDQFLLTGNVGLDFTVGNRVRLTGGLYTGPILFVFPKEEGSADLDINATLTSDEVTELEGYITECGADCSDLTTDALESEYNTNVAQQEEDLSRLGFGWNLARVRMAVDVQILPVVYLGFFGAVGYHYIISGEEAAAGAKNQAIDEYSKEYPDLPTEATDLLRKAVGAEEVDPNSLNGINYDAGLYLRFEFASGI